MPPSKAPPIIADMDQLSDPFHQLAVQLVALISTATIDGVDAVGLPMVVFETRRSLERQRFVYSQGNSRLSVGPHCFGLAIDVVLDPRDDRWPKFGARPWRAVDGGGAPWDTGYDADARGVVSLARQGIPPVWRKFGELAASIGLEWGGTWMDGRYKGYPFGWDVAHCQLPDWSSVAKTRGIQAQ